MRRTMSWNRIAILLGLFSLLFAGQAVAFSTPERTGWVTDAAHILDPGSLDALATRLENLQSETGDEVVVVTLPDLQGTTIENWGNVLGDNWKIGKANGQENGVLLIVAPDDRKVRIAVGHGLANRLSDSIAAGIISDHIIPYFRSGDMPQGIRAGIDSIALQLGAPGAVNGVEATPTSYAAPRPSFGSWLHDALTPSRHTLVISFWVLVVIVVVIFMLLNAANVGGGGWRRGGWYSNNYYGSSWGGGPSSSSGSSWGGGGSGGGGGSFGGGATGSW